MPKFKVSRRVLRVLGVDYSRWVLKALSGEIGICIDILSE